MSLNQTNIGWTDRTWNPITGCYGPGGTHENQKRCPYCFAENVATVKYAKSFPRGFDYHFREDRLGDPLTRKKTAKIFVCSMADLLGNWVPTKDIVKILETIRKTPHLTYQLLTKNPERYLDSDLYPWPRNCWLGASATNQEQWDRAIEVFNRNTFYNCKFISAEPLLEKIDPHGIMNIHQVIVGAQTGSNGQRVFSPPRSWVSEFYHATRKHDIKLFLKRNLGIPEVESFREMPEDIF